MCVCVYLFVCIYIYIVIFIYIFMYLFNLLFIHTCKIKIMNYCFGSSYLCTTGGFLRAVGSCDTLHETTRQIHLSHCQVNEDLDVKEGGECLTRLEDKIVYG